MTYIYGPLPILVSSRIRLSEEQRTLLRDAYHAEWISRQVPDRKTQTGISVTIPGVNSLDVETGMSSMVFSDIIASRDTISIWIILELQKVLCIEIITKKTALAAASSYADFVFSKA